MASSCVDDIIPLVTHRFLCPLTHYSPVNILYLSVRGLIHFLFKDWFSIWVTMSIDVNADEIFQLGIQIETNGKQFYETVARNSLDPPVKGLFSELAEWESERRELKI